MIAIGRYFVFMISVTATISFPDGIDDKFLDLVHFNIKILIEHNKVRADHGVPAFMFDNNLCEEAKEIRNKINNNQLDSIPNNLGWIKGSGKFNTIADIHNQAVSTIFPQWYNTGEGYDFENEPSEEKAKFAAPFTQIVWKNTTTIGVSLMATYDYTYDFIVVYSPKGNQINQYRNNVFKLKN